MKIEQHKELSPQDLEALFKLWNDEYPKEASFQNQSDLVDYLNTLSHPKHQLLKDDEGHLKAWFCTFQRIDLPWFAMIVSRDLQGQGWGRKLLEQAQKKHSILNGWAVDHHNYQKSDGSPYPSPLGFYNKLGFRKTKLKYGEGNLSVVHIVWP